MKTSVSIEPSQQTLYDKLWQQHVVHSADDGTSLLYIDRHLVHEVTSPQAFEGLRLAKRKPWLAQKILAVSDHAVPTDPNINAIGDANSELLVKTLEKNCRKLSIKLYSLNNRNGKRNRNQGTVHIVGPEKGATLPGMTIVCGDSHTSTHGAFGALAFGIGTSEVEHVLATQCLIQRKAKNMRIWLKGEMQPMVSAKDVALALIGKIGAAGCTGYAVEFAGACIDAMSMEARMTICNMAIEAGAKIGLIAVDDTTIDYLKEKNYRGKEREYIPKGELWERAEANWREQLHSDSDAKFDREFVLDVSAVTPQVTWGTSPDMVTDIDGVVPNPAEEPDSIKRESMQRALDYMGLEPGKPIRDIKLDVVFIGSCTNSRIEDLRDAAAEVEGKKVAENIKALVVPGSGLVKLQAEREGLDKVFKDAGFEWRNPGCSMCLGMNGDQLASGKRCASTSNRNFENRQGQGGRTHLVSPALAAAAAIAGRFESAESARARDGSS